MCVFTFPDYAAHENVVFCRDPKSGLKAIIAIHNTNLGPSLGGCRMYPYASEQDALSDVLRLSRGMTYKSALAGLPLGGGKSVIIGDPKTDKSDALFEALGREVNNLSGRYIIAQDSGIAMQDLQVVGSQSDYVAGIDSRLDEDQQTIGGDPSPSTAYGVFVGIQAAIKHKLGLDKLQGIRVAIQGVGNVGYNLARHLHAEGAELWVADVNQDNLQRAKQEFGATIVTGDEIFSLEVDVFAPCAMGGIINDATIGQLKASIVAGAANNQLLSPEHGKQLHQQGVLYAPDYVINAGGIIDIHYGHMDKSFKQMRAKVAEIGQTLGEIFSRSAQSNTEPEQIADELALERINAV